MSQGAGGIGARVLTHVPIVFLYDKCTHQHMYVCAGAHQVVPLHCVYTIVYGVLVPVSVQS